MPKQWITFRAEYDYRHTNVPYWSGPGGITPPAGLGLTGTNNGSPTQFACMNGSAAATVGPAPAMGAFGRRIFGKMNPLSTST